MSADDNAVQARGATDAVESGVGALSGARDVRAHVRGRAKLPYQNALSLRFGLLPAEPGSRIIGDGTPPTKRQPPSDRGDAKHTGLTESAGLPKGEADENTKTGRKLTLNKQTLKNLKIKTGIKGGLTAGCIVGVSRTYRYLLASTWAV
jgi:hypothetical protein